MDKELEDEETRNWVKVCLALRCLTKSMISYIKKKSEEQYSNNVTFLKTFVGVTEYSCSICNLTTLEPYHAQRKPCKYGHDKHKCACSSSGKQQCPDKMCGKLYDLIKDEHIKNNPNWFNSKSELWSDKQFGPWERIKCFIDTHGYKEKSDISLADITAVVQICTNNGNLEREFGINLKYLDKIKRIRNEVSHSSTMKITTVLFKEYIMDVKNALKLQSFDQYRSADQLPYLESLEKDGQRLTVEDEIGAREETLVAVKELIISLKKQLEQTQSLNEANSESIIENIKEEIAQLTMIEKQNFRQIIERFNEIERHLENLQNEYLKTKGMLSKHKAKLDSIELTLELHTTELCNISQNVTTLARDIKPILEKTARNNEVVERLEQKFDEFGRQLKRLDVPGMKLIIELNTSTGAETASELLVESSNGILRDRVLTELQKCLKSALDQICKDGVQIKYVKNECMAIYCGYPNMKSWLAFLRKYLNREFDQIFLPVQNHLRDYIGYEDLELNVVIYEEDFAISVQSIFYQLDTQLMDAVMFAEPLELDKSPLDNIGDSSEETTNREKSEGLADVSSAQESKTWLKINTSDALCVRTEHTSTMVGLADVFTDKETEFYGEKIVLQSNVLHGRAQLKILKLQDCTCEWLDLSSCHNLETIDLYKGITLQPNDFRGLAQLKILNLKDCTCERLDLSSCHNLETIDLYKGITLQRNPFRGLAQLKMLKLQDCNCEWLDLSSCRNLETIYLNKGITLQRNAFLGLAQLKILKLRDCNCEWLDLSSCHNLETIDLNKGITLQRNAFLGLAQLKILKLRDCTCEGLDLSSCHNLEIIYLYRGITLQRNAFLGLAQLKILKLLNCTCESLDLSSCRNLETIDLYKGITLQRNPFRGLAQLKMLKLLDCTCEWLGLSSCRDLETIDLYKGITLQRNPFRGLAQLKMLKLQDCNCEWLDLSSCRNLETIDLNKGITLQRNPFLELEQLKILKLRDCTCEWLALSSCHNLETIDLNKGITLKRNPFRGLAQLKMLKLQDCNCEWLDLSSCRNLETIDLNKGITLQGNAFLELAQLKILKLRDCNCEWLDLSACHNLTCIYLRGKRIVLQQLDLSSQQNLKKILGKGTPVPPIASHGRTQQKIL